MLMPTTQETPQLVTWSERYSVGIARIDAEHQKLIALVNELYAAMLAGKSNDVLARVLDGVASYTVTHFATEETLMKRHGYPAYAEHKAAHDKLVEQVKALQEQARAGKSAVSQEVMTFLQHWLLSHIAGMDKKYTKHLQAAGVK